MGLRNTEKKLCGLDELCISLQCSTDVVEVEA